MIDNDREFCMKCRQIMRDSCVSADDEQIIEKPKEVVKDNNQYIFAKINDNSKKSYKIASNQHLRGRKYLNVKYSEKDIVKGLGGRWDPNLKKWYVENHKDLQLFVDWF